MRIGFIVKCDSICGWIWIAIANCASFRECTWHKYCNFSLCALHTQSVSLHTQRLKAFNIHTTRTIRSSSRTTMFEVVALKLSQWIPNQSKYFHLYSLDLGMQFWGVAKKSDTLETHKRESERERMEKGGGGGLRMKETLLYISFASCLCWWCYCCCCKCNVVIVVAIYNPFFPSKFFQWDHCKKNERKYGFNAKT